MGPLLDMICWLTAGEEVEGRFLASSWGLGLGMLLNTLQRTGSPPTETDHWLRGRMRGSGSWTGEAGEVAGLHRHGV